MRLPLVIAGVYSLSHCLIFTEGSLAQSSIKLPYSERPQPEQIELLPSQAPPPTFRPRDRVPTGYAPPAFDQLESRQFSLYRLDIGDGVSVRVVDFPEFSFAGAVDPEGNLEVPILGRIAAMGLTLDELETKIQFELFNRYLREEPEVVAVLTSPRPVQLTVLGEVVRPGYYSLAPNTPITAVLQSAGGGTSNADLRSIIVRRALVDGTVLEKKFDLYTPLVEGSSLPQFRLQGGDTVIISRLSPGNLDGYDRQLIANTTLTQATITVRVLTPIQPAGVAFRAINLPNGSTFLDIVSAFPVVDSFRVNTREIALLRFDPVKGGIVTQSLRPEAAVRGDIAQNIPLQDQDVIIISRTLLGRFLQAFNVITQPIRDVLGFARFVDNLASGDLLDSNRRDFFR